MKNKLFFGLVLFIIGFFTRIIIKITYVFSKHSIWYTFLNVSGLDEYYSIAMLMMVVGFCLGVFDIFILINKKNKK